MLRVSKYLIVGGLASLFLSACSGGKKEEIKIPKNIIGVVKTTPEDLIKKSGGLEAVLGKIESKLSKREKKEFEEFKTILSGIDLTKKVYAFGTYNVSLMSQSGYAAVNFGVKGSALSDFIVKESKEKIEEKDGIKFIQLEEEVVIGFKGDRAMLLGSFGGPAKDKLFEYYSLADTSVLVANSENHFADFNNGKDISMWFNMGFLKSVIPSTLPFKDSIFNSFGVQSMVLTNDIAFEKGEFSSSSKLYGNKIAVNFLKDLFGTSGVSQEVLDVLKGFKSNQVVAANANLSAITKHNWVLDELGGMVKMFLRVDLDSYLNAFTGELVYATNGTFKKKVGYGDYSFEQSIPNIVVGAKIKDKEKATALLKEIVREARVPDSLRVEKKDGDVVFSRDSTIMYLIKGDILFLTTKIENVEAMKAGGKIEVEQSILDKAKANSYYTYSDIQSYISTMASEGFDIAKVKEAVPVTSAESISKTTDKGLESTYKIVLSKKDKNSLEYIQEGAFKVFDIIQEYEDQMMKKYEEELKAERIETGNLDDDAKTIDMMEEEPEM